MREHLKLGGKQSTETGEESRYSERSRNTKRGDHGPRETEPQTVATSLPFPGPTVVISWESHESLVSLQKLVPYPPTSSPTLLLNQLECVSLPCIWRSSD